MAKVLDLNQWLHTLTQERGVFVTGTDTGVGKTYVGTQLIRELKVLGLNITPRKPVESGWPEDETLTDAWQLMQAAQLPQSTLAQVCAHRFKAALAPDRAARLEGKVLTIKDLATAALNQTANTWLYVEGAGGVYSPIAEDGLNADLAQVLGLPVVLITEDKLGCMNHVLMAVEVLQRRQLTVAGVLLNHIHTQPNSMDNLMDLSKRLTVPVFQWVAH